MVLPRNRKEDLDCANRGVPVTILLVAFVLGIFFGDLLPHLGADPRYALR
jgi:hypothetical protein